MSKELDALSGIDIPNLSDFWNWVLNTFTPDYRTEIENYLSESVDLADLKRRKETLQRRGMI